MGKKVEDKIEPTVEVAAPKVVVTVTPPEKRISFDTWAARRGAKQHHLRGMRAHVNNVRVPRTAKEWDALFANY